MKKQAEKMKRQVKRGLSDVQSSFVNAIDFNKLDDALKDPEFIKVLNKIKL